MTIKAVRNLRRASQVVFFGIFLWLILKTTFEIDFSPEAGAAISLPYPVSVALHVLYGRASAEEPGFCSGTARSVTACSRR